MVDDRTGVAGRSDARRRRAQPRGPTARPDRPRVGLARKGRLRVANPSNPTLGAPPRPGWAGEPCSVRCDRDIDRMKEDRGGSGTADIAPQPPFRNLDAATGWITR